MKKHITLLLLLALLAQLTACGGGTSADTTASGDTTAPTVEEDDRFVKDDLPALDYGGKTVNVTMGDYNDGYFADMYTEEANGNRLNDAVFNMLTAVEQRLNVDLVYLEEQFDWNGMGADQTNIASQIMAGDAGMDILFSGFNNMAALQIEGEYFLDLATLEHVSLDKPWYNQSVLDNLATDTVDFVLGEFSIANIKHAYCMYFNQSLMEDMGIKENMYEIVESGKWTLDKLAELIKGGYVDLNGNTERDFEDRYGLTFGDKNKLMGFIKSCGVDMFKKEGDVFNFEYDSERAVNTIQKLRSIIYDSGETSPALNNNDQNPDWLIYTGGSCYASRMYMEGNSLFTGALLQDAATMAPEVKFTWGMVPYPKYDETMQSYDAFLQRACYAMVPVIAADPQMSGAVLEAISSESYRSMIPEYMEVTLKVRYSPDDNVSRMFDTIRNNIVYDPGELYAIQLGTPSALWKNGLDTNAQEWASFMASKKPAIVEKMGQIAEVAE